MSALLVSTGVVAIAEIGDKTQLLSLVLAARFRQPWAIAAGILVATLANHAAAAALGAWFVTMIGPEVLRFGLALGFLAMAVWTLVPDRLDEAQVRLTRLGVFAATTLAFFVAEIGDKTQIATVALAARYDALLPVVLGTTVGMMIANVPVIVLGKRATQKLPMRWVRGVAAAVFAALGLGALFV